MSKQMKRIAAIAACLIIGFCTLPSQTVSALEINSNNIVESSGDGYLPDPITCGDYEYYDLDDGEILICKYNGTDENVIVADKVDGKTVTGIQMDTFSASKNVKTIDVPASIEQLMGGFFCRTRRFTKHKYCCR